MHLPDPKHRLQFPGLPGVFGWICIEGEPLEVYDATEDESRTVAYVESKDDVKFSVHFLDTRKKAPEDPFVVLIDVDGAKRTKFRPFVFRKLFTTDQAQEACNDRDFVDNLGTIQLKICRIEHVRRIATCYKAKAPEGRIVDEQKKKARLTHQVAHVLASPFNEQELILIIARQLRRHCRQPRRRRSRCKYIDKPKDPLSSLIFRYRSKLLLQIEGHAPDPDADKKAERAKERHSPSPRLSADTDDSLPPQVARRQLADKRAELEMLEIEKRIAKVKREILVLEGGEEVDDPKRKRVKFEEGVKDESEAVGDGKKESKEMGKGGKKVTVIDLD
ncbi:hypothetical protein OF846_001843 [Rhodotorula toruloides]|nr:hypothetical protein OF846_001843 [Rhodotorula toruloides]